MSSELTKELIEMAAREEALMAKIKERILTRRERQNRMRVTENARGDD